jgi:ribosomal protein L23
MLNKFFEKLFQSIFNISKLISSGAFLAGGLILVSILAKLSILSTITNYVSYVVGIVVGILIYKTGGFENIDRKEIDKLKEELEETKKIEEEKNRLSEEVDRLKGQKISITQLEDIFKVSMFKIDTTITDLKRTRIGEDIEFLSVIRQDLKLNYGVDFKSLRIIETSNAVEIYNLNPSFTGFDEHPNYKPLLLEVRENRRNILLSNENSILKINGKNADSILIDSKKQDHCIYGKDEHEKELKGRISKGPEELKWLEEPIKQKSKVLLQLFFPNKEIIIKDGMPPNNAILLHKIIN